MSTVDPVVARKTWRTLEPIHGLIYFAPEAAERYAALVLTAGGRLDLGDRTGGAHRYLGDNRDR